VFIWKFSAINCFDWLDAPVMRCASLNTRVPFAAELEQNFLPKSQLAERIGKLMQYRPALFF